MPNEIPAHLVWHAENGAPTFQVYSSPSKSIDLKISHSNSIVNWLNAKDTIFVRLHCQRRQMVCNSKKITIIE